MKINFEIVDSVGFKTAVNREIPDDFVDEYEEYEFILDNFVNLMQVAGYSDCFDDEYECDGDCDNCYLN